MNLPPGFRFNPRDDELINLYLKPKIMGHNLPCNIINDDVQVYAPDSTPWLLFNLDDHDSWIDSPTTKAEKTLYVFTSLSKLATDPSNNTTRCNTNKKAGCGTWVQRTKRIPIIDRDSNVIIGGKRMLNFAIHDAEAQFYLDKAVYFKMHEYSLWGVNDNLGSDIVICKITFNLSKKSPRKKATKTSDQVSRRGRKPQNKIKNSKNLEGSSNWTSESVPPVMMTSNVKQESTSLHPDSSVAIDANVGNGDWHATVPYDIGVEDFEEFGKGMCFDGQSGGEGLSFDDQGGEDLFQSFDIAGFEEYMKFNPEVPPIEDRTIQGLGKRKFAEGDNSCQAKKTCF